MSAGHALGSDNHFGPCHQRSLFCSTKPPRLAKCARLSLVDTYPLLLLYFVRSVLHKLLILSLSPYPLECHCALGPTAELHRLGLWPDW